MIDQARMTRATGVLAPFAHLFTTTVFAATVFTAAAAHAQQAPATTGTTEVATSGFQPVVKPPPAEDANDGTQLKFTAGGLLTQGNSRTIAATASSDFRLRRNVSHERRRERGHRQCQHHSGEAHDDPCSNARPKPSASTCLRKCDSVAPTVL